jgi:hypothetical protein
MKCLRGLVVACSVVAFALGSQNASAVPTTEFSIVDGNCYITHKGLNDGVQLEIARERNGKHLIFYVTNSIWKSLKDSELDITMKFLSLPKPDGNGGVKRFRALDPVGVDAMALPPGDGDPGFAFVMSDEMADLMAQAGEQGLRFGFSQKGRDLTAWYYLSKHDLSQLNRCVDPFSN